MNLNFPLSECIELLQPTRIIGSFETTIRSITIDTRLYSGEKNACFIALKGAFRNGMDFLEEAYQKSIRVFIVSEEPKDMYCDACYLVVNNPLWSLQCLAIAHRNKFNIPLVGISGRVGKTTVKEWLYELLKFDYHIVRSPKSYNSQIGVALSLFELNEQATLAIIEMGISEAGELNRLMEMARPTHWVITSKFNNFLDAELSSSVSKSPHVFCGFEGIMPSNNWLEKTKAFLPLIPFSDIHSIQCAQLAIGMALELDISPKSIAQEISNLTRLALRLETFYGKNNSLVLNDTYNLDLETLSVSLQHMVSLAGNRKRCSYIGLDEPTMVHRQTIIEKAQAFADEHVYVDLPERLPFIIPEGAMVLVKGTRKARMERFAARMRLKQHQTVLEINLSALRQNLAYFKSKTSSNTRLLAMVKAQSYGTGLEQMAEFLEGQGIDYLGVAYTSEGVALRAHGVNLPILVLNPDPESYEDCIRHKLEPTVFTFRQLDRLIRDLIFHGIQQFPIHVEIDTGMRRLGFEPSELKNLLERIKAQPEVRLASVFTHFVESDNLTDPTMCLQQIELFSSVKSTVEQAFSYSILFHMANSEAILNFPKAHFDMVRIGLGMFGISSAHEEELVPVLSWKCLVSQIKKVRVGESVGYSRSFIAEQAITIAILPLGYADGFPRRLSNGIGAVKIRGVWCPTVGKVCMDMLMLDVTHLPEVKEGDEAVLFDDKASLLTLAQRLNTIPYEVMTGISDRVHRVYIRE
ncbi:MAG: alanine racemase [Bacteroidota bacterium]